AEWREKTVAAAAEAGEEVRKKYLEEGVVSVVVRKKGLRKRAFALEIVPIPCGSASKHKGVQAAMEPCAGYLPSPVDTPPIKGVDANTGEPIERKASDDEPFSALAFKIMTDPFVGTLTFVRVYSGVLSSGDSVINSQTGNKERIGRLLRMHANTREELKEIRAGDIAAC